MSHPIHILIKDGDGAIIKDFKDWNEVYDFIGVNNTCGDSYWTEWHVSNGEEGRPGPKFVGGWIDIPPTFEQFPRKVFVSAEELNRIPNDYSYCKEHNEYYTSYDECPDCLREFLENQIQEELKDNVDECSRCHDIFPVDTLHHTEDGPMCDLCYANTQEPTPKEE